MSMKLYSLKHSSKTLIPAEQRSMGFDTIVDNVLTVGWHSFYNLLIVLFDRWYGYLALAVFSFVFYIRTDNFDFTKFMVVATFLVLGIWFFKSDKSGRNIPPKLDLISFGKPLAMHAMKVATKIQRKYGKNSNPRIARDERVAASNIIRMLVDSGVYKVLNPHTGRPDLAGYEIELIQVPSVLCSFEEDDLGLTKIQVTISAPLEQMRKLDSLSDSVTDTVSRFYGRSLNLLSSKHDSGDFILSFADSERKTGFDFNSKNIKKEVKSTTDLTPSENVPDISDVNSISLPNQYTEFLSLAQSSKDYEVPIMDGVTWNLSKAQHLLIAGKSGSGKTYYVNYVIMMLALHNCSLYLADPKHSDLSSFDQFVGADRVATTPDGIVKLTQHVVDVMNERYEKMSQLRAETHKFQVDFTAFGLKPVVLVIDEMASLMSEFSSKKDATEFQSLITQITMKGRQAGVEFISIMQQANATNISTQARDQFGFRCLLGNSNSQERQMMFGSVEDYPDVPVGPGHGLFVMDGLTTDPRVLNTPRLDEQDNALYETLRAVFGNYAPIE